MNSEEKEGNSYKPIELLYKIFTDSRSVFKYVTEKEYNDQLFGLLFLAGVSEALSNAEADGITQQLDLPIAILVTVIFGGLLGWISYYFSAWLLKVTGTWIGGKAETKSILRVLAYAAMPTIISLLLWIPKVTLYGTEFFQENYNLNGDWEKIIFFYFFAWTDLILGIFTLILSVIGLSVVQEFSIWKSIFNIFLAFLLVFIPVFIFVLLFIQA